MDDDTASRFVSSLVKSIQALCNGYIDFSSSIEVVGHIHLNIDRNVKLDYVLTEEVSKSLSEGSTVFASHSYHSKPLSNLSKSSGDHSNRNKKSQQNNDTDPLGIGSLPPEVPNATRSESHSRTANRVCDSGDSSLSGSQDFDSVKQENRSSCQVRDSFEKRRRSGPGRRSPSPVAKRGRSNDTNSGVDVIEIKEEPDDEPSVFFGNSAGGADIQTPDFSNVVMESLDRVGQAEGASLVAGDVMQMNKQQPFPVMLHSNMPSTSSSVTGQSDPRASTSGDSSSIEPLWIPMDVCRFGDGRQPEILRNNYRRYSPAHLNEAVQRVLNGETILKVSAELNVPRETLRRHTCKAKQDGQKTDKWSHLGAADDNELCENKTSVYSTTNFTIENH